MLLTALVATNAPERLEADHARGVESGAVVRLPELMAKAQDGLAPSSQGGAGRIDPAEARAEALEIESAVLRDEIERQKAARRALEFEALELRRAARESQEQLRRLKATISFRIGSAMVEAAQSLPGALRLPRNLYGVFRASRELKQRRLRARQPGDAPVPVAAGHAEALHDCAALAEIAGVEVAAGQFRAKILPRPVLARILAEIAKTAPPESHVAIAALAAEALALNPLEDAAKWLAFTLFDRGQPSAAARLLDDIQKAGAPFNATEARRAEMIRAHARLAKSRGNFSGAAAGPVHP